MSRGKVSGGDYVTMVNSQPWMAGHGLLLLMFKSIHTTMEFTYRCMAWSWCVLVISLPTCMVIYSKLRSSSMHPSFFYNAAIGSWQWNRIHKACLFYPFQIRCMCSVDVHSLWCSNLVVCLGSTKHASTVAFWFCTGIATAILFDSI